MIKNIDQNKMERAYNGKAICHSLSGANVDVLQEKMKNAVAHEFSDIIIHIGTNDLVKDNAKTVSTRLESLIQQVKPVTSTVAISSVIARDDGKVPDGRISTFNKLTEELCSKWDINYIDNENINGYHLNLSGTI